MLAIGGTGCLDDSATSEGTGPLSARSVLKRMGKLQHHEMPVRVSLKSERLASPSPASIAPRLGQLDLARTQTTRRFCTGHARLSR